MINLSVRGYSLDIGGLDCTDALISISGGDNKAVANAGIVSYQYEIVLGRPTGFESIDDRLNNRWARGTEIYLRVANSTNTLSSHRRFSRLHIQDTAFDPNLGPGGQLKIQAVDLLTLLEGREQEEGATEVCAGTGLSTGETINQLLTSAGVPAPKLLDVATLNMPGTIPAPLNPSGGYIAQAGQLAASIGWILFYDGIDNRVSARRIDVEPTAPIGVINIAEQSTSVERLIDSPPAQKIKVTTRGEITRSIQRNGDVEITEEYGPASLVGIGFEGNDSLILIERVTRTDLLVGAERRVVTITEKPRGAVFPGDPDLTGTSLVTYDVTTERWFFESGNPVAGGGGACAQGNTGRLLRKTLVSLQPQGVACASAIAVMEEPKPSKTQQITAMTEETTYEYFPPVYLGPGQTRPLGRGPKIRRTRRQPIGAIIPDFYAADAFPQVTAAIADLRFTEYEYQAWEQPSLAEWEYKRRLSKSVGLAYPDLMTRRAAYAKEKNITFDPIAAFVSPVTVESKNDRSATQNQPPAPETLPPSTEVDSTENTVTYDLPVDGNWPYRTRTETLSFDNVPAGVADLAIAQAKRWGTIAWGRYKGSQVSCALLDTFFTYRPLDRIDLIEPGAVTRNLADGFTFSMVGDTDAKAQVQFEAIYMGREIVPAINTVVQSPIGLRSIGPGARADGSIAFSL